MGALSSTSCKRPAPAQLPVYMFLHIYVAGGVCNKPGGTQGDGVCLGAPHVSCAATCGIDVFELSRIRIGSGGLGLLSMPGQLAGKKRLHCFKSGTESSSAAMQVASEAADLDTYFCSSLRLMPLANIDPSLAIGFYCSSLSAWDLIPS